MKRLVTLIAIAAVAALLAVPSTAFAGDQDETVYDFEGEDLEGALVRPDGEQITGDDRGRTSSLIDIREDFIPEMLESVETIE